MTKEVKILIVDDEEDIIEFIQYNLEKEGYEVRSASNGNEALDIASSYFPHLIILDIMMPGLNGIEVCEKLRASDEFNDTIIAFLTARNESFTHVSALEIGGDDFINKPIKPNVFKSRVKALLRRHALLKQGNKLNIGTFGNLEINFDDFKVTNKGEVINLAKKEFELLCLLATKPGKVYKRSEILRKVWGHEVIVGDRTIDVHVRKLREKIGKHFIHTLKGVGYKFEC